MLIHTYTDTNTHIYTYMLTCIHTYTLQSENLLFECHTLTQSSKLLKLTDFVEQYVKVTPHKSFENQLSTPKRLRFYGVSRIKG